MWLHLTMPRWRRDDQAIRFNSERIFYYRPKGRSGAGTTIVYKVLWGGGEKTISVRESVEEIDALLEG